LEVAIRGSGGSTCGRRSASRKSGRSNEKGAWLPPITTRGCYTREVIVAGVGVTRSNPVLTAVDSVDVTVITER
jgi:hypothetical protein